ncbi:tRNA/rRNA methyltransferase (SpoU) [Rubrobacter xylanophilus DSM 9941]|uniref:tRNA/rRNA methyltransferase (SpoU) n=1 Tax=Rubrobacter xylanophilus (strain DSM 9941 / JCM 11954 / NBRC 16129 / PRD-1) TaxID=266117 RepID=Q1AWG0_RUBXD|nr:RNA methyltransferase [Rubrobacter xylanophilus]ABG04268.1 tRNA/rRNA methyltransferase (SpoU) [Rubrobacter xylanophilus DSM 9941]
MISPRRARRLQRKRYREEERLFLAEGERLLAEATVPPLRVFTEPEQIRRVSTLKTPAGPVGVFPYLDVSPEELLARGRIVVLLEGVQDPGNVGTVIRSAHAFGAGVALSRGCADLYNPKTVRSTMGSLFRVPVARELDPLAFLELARGAGFGLAAATPGGGEPPGSMPGGNLVVAVGSEGAGLSPGVVRACGVRVSIPSRAPSLNAAVAASILLYEAYRRVLT